MSVLFSVYNSRLLFMLFIYLFICVLDCLFMVVCFLDLKCFYLWYLLCRLCIRVCVVVYGFLLCLLCMMMCCVCCCYSVWMFLFVINVFVCCSVLRVCLYCLVVWLTCYRVCFCLLFMCLFVFPLLLDVCCLFCLLYTYEFVYNTDVLLSWFFVHYLYVRCITKGCVWLACCCLLVFSHCDCRDVAVYSMCFWILLMIVISMPFVLCL